MRINFGCGYAFVPKHNLYHAQIGTPLEQMGGKGVTEGVWTDGFLYTDPCHKFLYVVKHRYARERLFQTFTDEDKILVTTFYGNTVTVGEICLKFSNSTR